MPTYTTKEGHDSFGPIWYVELTIDGRKRIFSQHNQKPDAEKVAKWGNDEVRRAQAVALTTGNTIQAFKRNGRKAATP